MRLRGDASRRLTVETTMLTIGNFMNLPCKRDTCLARRNHARQQLRPTRVIDERLVRTTFATGRRVSKIKRHVHVAGSSTGMIKGR